MNPVLLDVGGGGLYVVIGLFVFGRARCKAAAARAHWPVGTYARESEHDG